MAMRTTLHQQLEVIRDIDAQASLPQKALTLRHWLRDMGYEEPMQCTHQFINRKTKRCQACGADTTNSEA